MAQRDDLERRVLDRLEGALAVGAEPVDALGTMLAAAWRAALAASAAGTPHAVVRDAIRSLSVSPPAPPGAVS